MIRVQHNVKPLKFGRKDVPPTEGWKHQYDNFPIEKLKKRGYSFNTGIWYEYGKTICVKNACRIRARKLNLKMRFSVGEWRGKIRVWRTK